MMRLNVIVLSLLFAATGAIARPAAPAKPPIPQNHLAYGHALLDLAHLHLFRLFHPAETSQTPEDVPPADPTSDWSRQSELPDLSMGPLHPEIGHDDNPFSGLSASEMPDQLGSSVWKDLQNRSHSAKLMFIWPTDK